MRMEYAMINADVLLAYLTHTMAFQDFSVKLNPVPFGIWCWLTVFRFGSLANVLRWCWRTRFNHRIQTNDGGVQVPCTTRRRGNGEDENRAREREKKTERKIKRNSTIEAKKNWETLYDLSGLARASLLFLFIMPWHWLTIQFHHCSIAFDKHTHECCENWTRMKNQLVRCARPRAIHSRCILCRTWMKQSFLFARITFPLTLHFLCVCVAVSWWRIGVFDSKEA